jgi:hypothetical protein
MSDLEAPTVSMLVKVRSTEERLSRTKVFNGPDIVVGKFSFILAITATAEDIYVPISIASSNKPVGFVYQIEGTAQSSILTTHISCKGNGITQVRLGTIVYCKIPTGMIAEFRIRIEVRGQVGKLYKVLIYLMHYKRSPTDARYQKFPQKIGSRMLKFS